MIVKYCYLSTYHIIYYYNMVIYIYIYPLEIPSQYAI